MKQLNKKPCCALCFLIIWMQTTCPEKKNICKMYIVKLYVFHTIYILYNYSPSLYRFCTTQLLHKVHPPKTRGFQVLQTGKWKKNLFTSPFMSLCGSCECLLSTVAGKHIGGSTLCLCVVWSRNETVETSGFTRTPETILSLYCVPQSNQPSSSFYTHLNLAQTDTAALQ